VFAIRKSKQTPLVAAPEKFDTLIGRRTEVHGKLVIQESIRIDGRLVGDVEAPPGQAVTVVISASGEVQGDVTAHRVVVAGKISGQIHAPERVELHAGCRVQGDIRYGSIAIEHGARVLGLLLHVENEAASAADQGAHEAIRRAQA